MNCKIDKLAISRRCIETNPSENDSESCESRLYKGQPKCYTRKISKPKKSLTRKVSKKEAPEPKPVKKIEEAESEPEPEPVKKQEEDEEIENVNVIEYLQLSSVSTFFPNFEFDAISTFLTEEKFPEDPIELNKYLLED
tara:strand:- start:163 stop:579 length:417 start_codon:yes stop_codon:yes gene_type:complete